MNSSESPESSQGRKNNLARELIAYFQHAASTVGDAARLEEMLDELCSSDEKLLTEVQVELRRRQAHDVRNLLKDKDRMTDALREVYSEAMDEASAVGGGYYRDTATKLTELEAEGLRRIRRSTSSTKHSPRYWKLSRPLGIGRTMCWRI